MEKKNGSLRWVRILRSTTERFNPSRRRRLRIMMCSMTFLFYETPWVFPRRQEETFPIPQSANKQEHLYFSFNPMYEGRFLVLVNVLYNTLLRALPVLQCAVFLVISMRFTVRPWSVHYVSISRIPLKGHSGWALLYPLRRIRLMGMHFTLKGRHPQGYCSHDTPQRIPRLKNW